jgi:carboxymethylenebutenolidase
MTILPDSHVDLSTHNGPMRVHLFIPTGGGKHPAIIFYSEIFQVTGPIRRMAAALAGNGYLVAVPEVYHEFEALGTVLAYDQAGSDRGNELKYAKSLASYDADSDVVARFLVEHERCTGKIGSFGVCLGGHLAVRAAFHPLIAATGTFYPTDLHSATLGEGKNDDTLTRIDEIKTPFLFVFGRQDPHIPLEGRRKIQARLEAASTENEWHEFNAAHAFLRDEGPRYNPALARLSLELLLRFFSENLGA